MVFAGPGLRRSSFRRAPRIPDDHAMRRASRAERGYRPTSEGGFPPDDDRRQAALADRTSSRIHRRTAAMLARLPAWPRPTGSGWPDSNRRPPAPKAGALTKLRHIPWNRSVAYRPFAGPHGAARPLWRGPTATRDGRPRRWPPQLSREFRRPSLPTG